MQPSVPPAYSPSPAPERKIWLGDLLSLGGGFFIFIFSFAPFVTYPTNLGFSYSGWYMAWSPQMFMAPLSWLPILAALGAAALAIVRMVTGRDPEFVGFQTGRVQVGLAFFAFLVLFGYAASQKQSAFGVDSFSHPMFGWGGYLMLIWALVGVAGAMLNHFRVAHLRVNLAVQQPPPAPPYPAAPSYGWNAPSTWTDGRP